MAMKLIVGLGNIDSHFEGTRHNVGFSVVELFAALNNMQWQAKDKFKASVAEGQFDGEKVLLAKPNTYYNNSGDAVLAIKQFYKLSNNDILVVHDELDLAFGTVRTRPDGSDAGNNGIKSIIATIGGDFTRLRIGIKQDQRPGADAVDFVLGHFSHDENQKLGAIKKHACDMIEAFIDGTLLHTTVTAHE